MENFNDFNVHKFYIYKGSNYYLNERALVFNIFLDPEGPEEDYYKEFVYKEFPVLIGRKPSTVIDLFASTLIQILKMDIDLFINDYSIGAEGDDYVVAVEFFDEKIARESVLLLSEWFKSINNKNEFDFRGKWKVLQESFNQTLLGGPTIYSLVEAGLKRKIPVFFLNEEDEFQWGYGKKQLRGRSTTFHTDSIKDTEFTMYKDMVGNFLTMCGLPSPIGKNCFSEDEAVDEALKLGFPVVLKPVAGHKGQGVTTNIESEEGVRKAYNVIINAYKQSASKFEGIIVQQQIYGTDHRVLTVNGKFVAALERVPAYIIGNGTDTIETLIKIDNEKKIRLDNARSPLCKIKIDDDMNDYLTIQGLSLNSVPKTDEIIYLRRIANISAGGVSINVTDKIHPKNIEMVESIAKFFSVKCLGIDVMTADISKPWNEGSFGIIEINSGPGVFMHLAPAIGDSIDVPGLIMLSHFKKPENARIPIIAGNNITKRQADFIYEKLKNIKTDIGFASLIDEGIFFNGVYFCKNTSHDQNVKIILRDPTSEFAVFSHNSQQINNYGFFHESADIVILDNPDYTEESMKNILLEHGILFEITDHQIEISINGEVLSSISFFDEGDKENLLLTALEPILKALIFKYD
ncbi:MAG: cyanophycin synthetase [Bacteroidetes bacterium]|nr:cyanophycin synthetase [Bacteroidota bacterium]